MKPWSQLTPEERRLVRDYHELLREWFYIRGRGTSFDHDMRLHERRKEYQERMDHWWKRFTSGDPNDGFEPR